MAGHRGLRLVFLADPNETHTHRWMRWFASRGHDLTLVGPPDIEPEGPLPDGVRLLRLPSFGGRPQPLGLLDMRRAIRSVVVPLDPDVVHVHYLTGYGWLAWASGIRPYVVTVWGSDIFRTLPASRKARILGRLALGAADVVTADSRDLAEGAIAAGARRDRTEVVQFGVETGRFTPGPPDEALRARLGLRPGRLVFAARTLMDFYRPDVALRALALLPDDVSMLFSARHEDPAVRGRLESLIDVLGVRERVTIVDTIAHDDMVGALRLADVVLSIPETDGTPVTILEAMALARPVVASDVPSVREWLGRVAPDRLVPAGDVDATAAALLRVLGTPPDEAAEVAREGRALVIAEADHDANMHDVEATYRRLAGARRREPAATAGRPA